MDKREVWILDRVEDGTAYLETETGMQAVPARELPAGAREGDCLQKGPDGLKLDAEETQRRKQRIQNKLDRLLKRSKT